MTVQAQKDSKTTLQEQKTPLDKNKLWQAVKARMLVELSETRYNTSVKLTDILNIDEQENTIEISCRNKGVKNLIEKLYLPLLEECVQNIAGKPFKLKFRVIGKEKDTQNTKDPRYDEPLFYELNSPDDVVRSAARKSGLNPEYTFEKYIMGPNNHLAYAVATRIADQPGVKHNPFFLYAGVGLGKTHLIQAIGNKLVQKRADLRIIYCTSESFANEFIEILKKGKNKNSYSTDEFRKKYRTADVFIIDDIQFISGKESTKEEFFHTFNELYMKQKQIIIASDRPPEEFKGIEDRITSRFKSGMLADISAPEFEVRAAILRARRDTDKDKVPNQVLDFIAEHITTNIRELEGAYHQVVTWASSKGKELNLETAKEALSNVVQDRRQKPLNLNDILKAVCNYYSVKQADIKGQRRTKDLVIPRQVAMFLIYELTGTPLMTIGEFLGGRDHTTIMYGVKKVQENVTNLMTVKNDIINIKRTI